MNESTAIALVDALKKLNETIEEHNDILINHYSAVDELDMELVEFPDLDS